LWTPHDEQDFSRGRHQRAATFLGLEKEFRTIEVGKRADDASSMRTRWKTSAIFAGKPGSRSRRMV